MTDSRITAMNKKGRLVFAVREVAKETGADDDYERWDAESDKLADMIHAYARATGRGVADVVGSLECYVTDALRRPAS